MSDMIYMRSMTGVTLPHRNNNAGVRTGTGMVRKSDDRVDLRGLRWFGHLMRVNDERMVIGVIKAEVTGCWLRGRTTFGGWMT